MKYLLNSFFWVNEIAHLSNIINRNEKKIQNKVEGTKPNSLFPQQLLKEIPVSSVLLRF